MSDAPRTYRFVVDALSPDRVPMARLAEYIADLARLFGYKEHVHFVRVASRAADADVRAGAEHPEPRRTADAQTLTVWSSAVRRKEM